MTDAIKRHDISLVSIGPHAHLAYSHFLSFHLSRIVLTSQGKSNSPTAASFVRPSRPANPTRHFLQAIQDKYASEYTLADGRRAVEDIVFFGKRAEEVGFEKIRRKQANIGELTVVILEDLQVNSAGEKGLIAKTCPKITQLDLSRNLFETLDPVGDICRELPSLTSLSLR